MPEIGIIPDELVFLHQCFLKVVLKFNLRIRMFGGAILTIRQEKSTFRFVVQYKNFRIKTVH